MLAAKSDYTASEKVFNREEEQLLGAVVPVRDRTGAVQGALIAELPAENLHFTQLGFLDLGAHAPRPRVAGLSDRPEPEELGFTAEPPVQEEPPADTETPEPPAEQ